jgi:hypothetical protein
LVQRLVAQTAVVVQRGQNDANHFSYFLASTNSFVFWPNGFVEEGLQATREDSSEDSAWQQKRFFQPAQCPRGQMLISRLQEHEHFYAIRTTLLWPNPQEKHIMTHPLLRIFIPVSNIVFIAALTVAIVTSEIVDRPALDEAAIAAVATDADTVTTTIVGRAVSDRS